MLFIYEYCYLYLKPPWRCKTRLGVCEAPSVDDIDKHDKKNRNSCQKIPKTGKGHYYFDIRYIYYEFALYERGFQIGNKR